MVVPTGAVFVVGPIERFRPEGFNRRIRDDPPYQSFDPAVAGRVTLLRPADGTSKGWRPTTLLTRFAEELRRVG